MTRPLNTGDVDNDVPITDSVMELLWSFGLDDEIKQHGPRDDFALNPFDARNDTSCLNACSPPNGVCKRGCCACVDGFKGIDCSVVDNTPPPGNSNLPDTIDEAKYPFTAQLSGADYEIFWLLEGEGDAAEIEIGIRVKTKGWIAFGPSKNEFMIDADVIIGWIGDDGFASGGDYYIADRQFGCPDGVCLDDDASQSPIGTNDLFDINGNTDGVTTEIIFRRKLITGDAARDFDIIDDDINVVWGFNPDFPGPALVQHAFQTKGAAKINFFNGSAAVLSNDSLRLAHGALMFICWSIIVPIANFIARYLKRYTWWFNVHRILNGGAMIFMIIGFAIAIAMTTLHFDTGHKILGLIIVILGVAQPVLGTIADKLYDPDRPSTPIFPDKFHWFIGWITLLLGLINVAIGINVYDSQDLVVLAIYIVYAAVVSVFLTAYGIYHIIVGTPGH
jgi:hypothetical protein